MSSGQVQLVIGQDMEGVPDLEEGCESSGHLLRKWQA